MLKTFYVKQTRLIDYPDQLMHNIYINNILFIVSNPTRFDALHDLQGALSLYFANVIKIIKVTNAINPLRYADA